MDFFKYITDNSLILIPVLYVLGLIFKQVNFIKDKYIPLILLPIGIVFSVFLTGFNIYGVVQGILVVGVTVYGNQVFKQCTKKE